MKYNNKFNGLTYVGTGHFSQCTHKHSKEYRDTIKYYQCRRKGIIQDNGIEYLCNKHYADRADIDETEISLSYLERF